MSKAILPECEYCFLNSFRVSQMQADTDGYWELYVSISCDLLDTSRGPLPSPSMADTMVVVSGTTTSGMLTLSEIYSYMGNIETTVNNYMVWAKEEYAGYTG